MLDFYHRVTKHWEGTDPELSLITIEWEMVSPYKPLDVLSHGSTTNGHDYSSNLVLAHIILRQYGEKYTGCVVCHT